MDLPEAERATRIRFRQETRCMTALYERCLPRVKAGSAWKILVECVPSVTRPEPRDLLGVLTLQTPFDHDAYLAKDSEQRKRVAMTSAHDAIVRLAQTKGLPLESFQTAFEGVEQHNFVNEWHWPSRPVLSRDAERCAYLRCLHEPDRFKAWLIVETADGREISRAQVVDEEPNEFLFAPHLGSLFWATKNRAVLRNRAGAVVGEIQIEGS